ncbi:hypothetical protein EDB89DRAFT_1908748 [Lactarius sanguifluus]|nr:hypothetical protein EDB89DRAFT_1908748 [Lactarius sanguifluus]
MYHTLFGVSFSIGPLSGSMQIKPRLLDNRVLGYRNLYREKPQSPMSPLTKRGAYSCSEEAYPTSARIAERERPALLFCSHNEEAVSSSAWVCFVEREDGGHCVAILVPVCQVMVVRRNTRGDPADWKEKPLSFVFHFTLPYPTYPPVVIIVRVGSTARVRLLTRLPLGRRIPPSLHAQKLGSARLFKSDPTAHRGTSSRRKIAGPFDRCDPPHRAPRDDTSHGAPACEHHPLFPAAPSVRHPQRPPATVAVVLCRRKRAPRPRTVTPAFEGHFLLHTTRFRPRRIAGHARRQNVGTPEATGCSAISRGCFAMTFARASSRMGPPNVVILYHPAERELFFWLSVTWCTARRRPEVAAVEVGRSGRICTLRVHVGVIAHAGLTQF